MDVGHIRYTEREYGDITIENYDRYINSDRREDKRGNRFSQVVSRIYLGNALGVPYMLSMIDGCMVTSVIDLQITII